jgi:hypothetical protein
MSRAAPRMSAYSSDSSPVAAQITNAVDGMADANVASSQPNWQLVLPQSSPAGAWGGQQTQVDFNIQNSAIGKGTNYLLQFNVVTTGAPVLPPSAYFVDRVEIHMPNGEVAENVTADALFAESTTLLTDQSFYTVGPLYNVAVDGGLNPAPAAGTHTYWLSLNGSVLGGAQPYFKGFGAGFWQVRVFLTSNVKTAASAAAGTCALSQMQLWVQEAKLSDATEAALAAAHKSGIKYRTVTRSVNTINQPTGLVAGNQITNVMSGLSHASAGLYVYFKAQSADPANCLSRIAVANFQLQDANSRPFTQTLPAQMVESVIGPSVTPLSSIFVNSATFTTYIFPFCTSLDRVLNSGARLGHYKLTTQEKIVFTPSTTVESAVTLNIISWDLSTLHVKGNKCEITYE